jgi:hypothetical protein
MCKKVLFCNRMITMLQLKKSQGKKHMHKVTVCMKGTAWSVNCSKLSLASAAICDGKAKQARKEVEKEHPVAVRGCDAPQALAHESHSAKAGVGIAETKGAPHQYSSSLAVAKKGCEVLP